MNNELRKQIEEINKMTDELERERELSEELDRKVREINEDRSVGREDENKLQHEYEQLLNTQTQEMNKIKEQLEMERELCEDYTKQVNELKDQKGLHEMSTTEMEDLVHRKDEEIHELRGKLRIQKMQYHELEEIQMRHEEAFQNQMNQKQDFEVIIMKQKNKIDGLAEQLEMERELVDGLEKQVKELRDGNGKWVGCGWGSLLKV